MMRRKQRPVPHPAAVNTVRYFLFFVFLVPLAVFAQTDPSAPATEGQFRQIMELESQINALLVRRAADRVIEASAPRFVIPWDCSRYAAISTAYDMCQKAHGQMRLDTSTGNHEASHYINIMCRQMPEYRRGREGSCIHVGWKDGNPEVIWVDDFTNTSIPAFANSGCIPGSLQACSKHSLYLVEAPSRNQTDISYLRDEWGAYNIGAKKNTQKELQEGMNAVTRTNFDDALAGPAFFTALSGSMAEYMKRSNPVAFASPDFRLSLKLQIENSVGAIREALIARDKMGAYRNFKGVIDGTEKTRTMLESFTHSPQAKILRTMYGDAWFDRTFNIAF